MEGLEPRLHGIHVCTQTDLGVLLRLHRVSPGRLRSAASELSSEHSSTARPCPMATVSHVCLCLPPGGERRAERGGQREEGGERRAERGGWREEGGREGWSE